MAELLCRLYAHEHGVEAAIARCFAFVGPYLPLDTHFAAGNFVRDRLRGDSIRIAGDGTPRRSYLYAADLAVWLWTILLRAPAGRAFNVGSEEDLSIEELARAAARAGGGAAGRVEVAGSAVPGSLPERYVPSTRRIAAELGLEPSVTLADGLERTLRWHRAGGG
jgi:dTDP-glucose 4,6-dehydratase